LLDLSEISQTQHFLQAPSNLENFHLDFGLVRESGFGSGKLGFGCIFEYHSRKVPYLWILLVTTLHYGSPSHRVEEHQLLIPGFLPEFLETSGDQENLSFIEKVATTGN